MNAYVLEILDCACVKSRQHWELESAVLPRCSPTLDLFIYLLKPQHDPLQQAILHAILSYNSVVSVRLQLFVRTIYLFKVHGVYVSNELFEIPID